MPQGLVTTFLVNKHQLIRTRPNKQGLITQNTMPQRQVGTTFLLLKGPTTVKLKHNNNNPSNFKDKKIWESREL